MAISKNTKRIIYILVILVPILLVVFKLKWNKEVTQSKVYHYDKEQAINVQADTIKLESVNDAYNYSGTFEPNKESKISAEVQGKINRVFVDIGSIVTKGQSMVLLDNSLLKLQLQSVNVQIEGLQADVDRYKILTDADAIQGVQLEKAALGLKSAQVQRATLFEQISKSTIRAPFYGVVTAKLSEEGAFAAPGVPLLQITNISNLKFTINVPENDLSQFYLNQKYTITTDAYPTLSLEGKVTMIGSKANTGNSFPVQFTVNNTSDLKIKSGMFGKVQLNNSSQKKGIIIPISAIVSSANHTQVYLIQNGKSILQNIDISKKIQNKAVVSSGLNEGDLIVTGGFINLFDGANVKVN